jgi:periplasmic divalent cation tolerance protein
MILSVVYIPCPTPEVASAVGRVLVKEKLAACVNILGPTLSLYKEDTLVETQEYVLLAKTGTDRLEVLTQRVLQLHPYDTPAILSWEAGGSAQFSDWVACALSKDCKE